MYKTVTLTRLFSRVKNYLQKFEKNNVNMLINCYIGTIIYLRSKKVKVKKF